MNRFPTARAVLEVHMASQPISGAVARADGGEPQPFTGWIELTGAIESLRSAAPRSWPGTRAVIADAATPDTGASP